MFALPCQCQILKLFKNVANLVTCFNFNFPVTSDIQYLMFIGYVHFFLINCLFLVFPHFFTEFLYID